MIWLWFFNRMHGQWPLCRETALVGLSNCSVSKIQCGHLFILSGWIRSLQGHDVDFPLFFFLFLFLFLLMTELSLLHDLEAWCFDVTRTEKQYIVTLQTGYLRTAHTSRSSQTVRVHCPQKLISRYLTHPIEELLSYPSDICIENALLSCFFLMLTFPSYLIQTSVPLEISVFILTDYKYFYLHFFETLDHVEDGFI